MKKNCRCRFFKAFNDSLLRYVKRNNEDFWMKRKPKNIRKCLNVRI